MKKHAIIPIFIPHRGCPNDCVFCNQKIITARTAEVTPQDAERIIRQHLTTLQGRGLEEIEVAFFGGSFTGIPLEDQSAFLQVACRFKKAGLIDRIHMSTRPDYIDERILDNLQRYEADVIELGVQSFSEDVLRACKRGHTVDDVYRACELIKDRGFTLGIQLMIGLPGDTREKAVHSAKCAVSCDPELARLYPTVVLPDTELAAMCRAGDYRPLSEEEAVSITAEMYKILDDAGITILRVGLKSTDLVTRDVDLGGSYHPAFRQLVEGRIALERIEAAIKDGLQDQGHAPAAIRVESNAHSFSSMIGHHACNRKKLAAEYPSTEFQWAENNDLKDNRYYVRINP
ncbi:MAG: elongator complex protein 3 [Anaerovoracaceae bacterium]|jgi:histone acetyltransferase (RNA polymerase elongator complex component)